MKYVFLKEFKDEITKCGNKPTFIQLDFSNDYIDERYDEINDMVGDINGESNYFRVYDNATNSTHILENEFGIEERDFILIDMEL